MPRSCASFNTAVISAGFITEPDGLFGEFRMMTFVRGVMALLHHIRRQREIMLLVGGDVYRLSAGITNNVFERNPVRNRQNHFISMIHQHLNRIE